MDVLKLLNEIEDILEESSSIPLSKKVVVDKKEFLEIIKEIRIKLPDEIKQAEWIREERQRILAEAQSEADTIVEQVKMQIEELVEDEEITKKANERAEEIINKAKSQAKEIRIGAREYGDQILKEVQDYLKNLGVTLDSNRNELRGL